VLNDREITEVETPTIEVHGTQESNQLSLPLDKAKAMDEVEKNNEKEVAVFTTICNPTSTF